MQTPTSSRPLIPNAVGPPSLSNLRQTGHGSLQEQQEVDMTVNENREDIKELRSELQELNKIVARLVNTVATLVKCVDLAIRWAMMVSAPLVVSLIIYFVTKLLGTH